MCFSPQADTVAGVVVGVAAVDAVRHVEDRRQLILAALPAVLCAHQFIEVLVWWWLQGSVSSPLGRGALWAYLLVAFGLPTLVPLAMWSIEPDRHRRALMLVLGAAGATVTLWLFVGGLTGGVGAQIEGHHIVYLVGLPAAGAATGLYVVASCGALLLSSHRHMVLFGVANIFAVGLLIWLSEAGLFSLWCAWAAVTSVIVAAHLRRDQHRWVSAST
ncbi:MAG: DUF6629 family protein [Acidimicrobiales bacterium]